MRSEKMETLLKRRDNIAKMLAETTRVHRLMEIDMIKQTALLDAADDQIVALETLENNNGPN
jgi:hypothetical protein